MPAIIKNTRGDINKLDFDLGDGQLFWSYVNTDPVKSNGHTYSRGQLWIKDPSKGIIPIGGTDSNRALRLAGHISDNFDGDFLNANVTSQIEFAKCQEGDVFIFDKPFEGDNIANFKIPFSVGDFLVITKAVYAKTTSNIFMDKLVDVDYVKIQGAAFDNSDSDLEAGNLQAAVKELELRLKYNGEIYNSADYIKATKKKGFMYLSKAYLTLNVTEFELVDGNEYEGRFTGSRIKLYYGDFIFFNGKKWVLIPSGNVLSNLAYSVKADLDGIETFEDYHKNILKGITNVQDALDILCSEKAPLDHNHKIPYSVLPNSIKSGLVYMGNFYPVDVNENEFNKPENQNAYPAPIDDEGNELEVWNSGWFYIVDTYGKTNIQYKDKLNGRIIEVNSGDWIVWNKSTGRFEVIDNSDRVSAITVHTSSGKEVTLLGNVRVKSTSDFLKVEVADGVIDLQLTDELATKGEDGKPNYLPIYDSLGSQLLNSCLHENDALTELISELGFIVGSKLNEQFLKVFGDITLEPTSVGNTVTLSKNPVLNLVNIVNNRGVNLQRTNKLIGSTKLNFTDKDEVEQVVNIELPETDSRLIAALTGDELTPNYLTKTNKDGFVTNSAVYEDEDAVTIKNGQLNVKKSATSTVELYPEDEFIRVVKEVKDPTTGTTEVVEYSLQPGDVKAQLRINPLTIEDMATIVVYMPRVGGTLITEEYIKEMYSNGVALTIPTWELHNRNGEDYIGLSESPIKIRVNRKKSGNEKFDRENHLLSENGKGLETAWTYIGSNHTGSAQQAEQGDKSDIITFDAWVEAQRSIATKEGFVLPSTALLNDHSHYSDKNNVVTEDTEVVNDQLGKDGGLTEFARIVPSRSLFKWDPAYYDAYGNLKDQEIQKTVEMPAESGVLVTHNSLLRAPVYRTPSN